MTTADTFLAPFYQGWETYQGYLTNAIAPLTSEQLALCACTGYLDHPFSNKPIFAYICHKAIN
jgi:hypothetical protein